MLLDIVSQMAALAEVAEVVVWVVGVCGVVVVVRMVVVHVRDGEHYPTPGHWMRLFIHDPAGGVCRRAFAAIARPALDGRYNLRAPVVGIVAEIDWHY